MKSPSHSKRFAQFFLGLAALTFTQCNKPATDAPAGSTTTAPKAAASSTSAAAANSIALIGEGASPAFRAVASRLELGGRSYEYSEVGGATALAAFLDEIMTALPATEHSPLHESRRSAADGFSARRAL